MSRFVRLTFVLLFAACNGESAATVDDGGLTDALQSSCGPNLKPHRTACVPILDDCPDDRVPLPGGGCQRIGVEECFVDGRPGLRGPPDWTCRRVGPPLPCYPGWAPGADGLCEPVLPPSPCTADTMEVIGEASCQPVGDCETAPATTPDTLFVDASYTGSDADGSKTKPFPTIGQALKAAPESGQVTVAQGTYVGDLTIDRPLRLEGRCAAQVTILGKGAQAAVTVKSTGVELSGLRVTGPGLGVKVVEDARLTLTDVVVRNCGGPGVWAGGGARLTVTGSLLSNNTMNGILAQDADLTMERSVVRGTHSIQVWLGAISVTGSYRTPEVTLRHSFVSNNVVGGVVANNGRLAVEDTVVADTVPPTEAEADAFCKTLPPEQRSPDCVETHQSMAYGVAVLHQAGPTSLTLRRSLVRSCTQGVAALKAPATIEETIIRDGKPATPSLSVAIGGLLVGTDAAGNEPKVTVTDSVVTGNTLGIDIAGARLTLERTIVEKNGGSYWTEGGGIQAQSTNGLQGIDGLTSTVDLRDTLVRENLGSGILLFGAAASLQRSAVVDGRATELNQLNGYGIGAHQYGPAASRLALTDSLVARNRVAGVVVDDSDAEVLRTVIRDTREELLTGRFGRGIKASYRLRRPSLLLRQTLIRESRATGLELAGAQALVEGSAIRSTRPNKNDGLWGEGVYATIAHDVATGLTLTDSVVSGSHTTGVLLLSSIARVERSVIEKTEAEAGSGSFGDGIVVGPAVQGKTGWLELSDSLIQDSARAGLIFFGGTGRVRRSLLRRGLFGVALERGAGPDLGPRNVYEENQDNGPALDRNLAGPGPIGLPPAP